MPSFHALLPVLIALLSGCQTYAFEVDRPPIERSAREGLVCAWSEADAERVAGELDRLVPLVRALKGVECDPPLVILTREELMGGLDGLATDDLILLGPGWQGVERFVLAHELSHYFRDDVWGALPYAVEEGLADLVAEGIEPDQASFVLFPRLTNIPLKIDRPLLEGLLSLKRSLEAPLDETTDSQSRAIGFVVAIELGIEELRRLCVRARAEGLDQVPPDWILAEMPCPVEDSERWRRCITDHLNRSRPTN